MCWMRRVGRQPELGTRLLGWCQRCVNVEEDPVGAVQLV
jgi:hypothetical protein